MKQKNIKRSKKSLADWAEGRKSGWNDAERTIKESKEYRVGKLLLAFLNELVDITKE